MAGIISIGVGLVFIVGGLSGALALRGTNSAPLLFLVGAGLLIFGAYRFWQANK